MYCSSEIRFHHFARIADDAAFPIDDERLRAAFERNCSVASLAEIVGAGATVLGAAVFIVVFSCCLHAMNIPASAINNSNFFIIGRI